MREKARSSSFVKRLLAIFAALAMVLTMGVGSAIPAMAASDDGQITIKNTVTGETYNTYKVFDAVANDATKSNTDEGKSISYTYTKKAGTDNFYDALAAETSPFTLTQQGSSSVYNVTLKDSKTANDIVTFLNNNVSNLGTAVNTTTATAKTTGSQEGNDIQITGLAYGYYYITTTTGSAVTVDSAAKSVDVNDKNTVPSMDKKQSTTEDGTYQDAKLDLNIGDKVYYQITVTAGKTNNKQIKVTDTLSEGLTLHHTGSGSETVVGTVTKGGETVANTNYEVTGVTDRGFTITFKEDYVKTLNENDAIVIKYYATLNDNAVVNSETGNSNNAKMEYSRQTTEDTVYVETYDVKITKELLNN